MRLIHHVLTLAILLSSLAWGQASQPKIQIALLLDTSNSMDGLIDQAKSELWNIVNEFALAEKNGLTPEIQIALYEYGNDGLPADEGYLRQVSPLTTDLDAVSEALFSLTTNGGSEYCAWVIQKAVQTLEWSASFDDLKLIFIAGNEGFNQGKIDFRTACRDAISRGIIVNTIFCGSEQEGIDTFWKEGAELADGRYASIDHNRKIVHIPAPQDSALNRLNQELNKTYLAYGSQGKVRKERQARQDANAYSYGSGAGASRASVKASKSYKNASWDLVDAVEEEAVVLESLPEDDLPEELRGKTPEEAKKLLQAVKEKRERIQAEIRQLDAQRKKYLAEHRAKDGNNTLDRALVGVVREQAQIKSFKFRKP